MGSVTMRRVQRLVGARVVAPEEVRGRQARRLLVCGVRRALYRPTRRTVWSRQVDQIAGARMARGRWVSLQGQGRWRTRTTSS
eukprot:COSAG02_NODE_59155_length_275_cov_0.585227_1_plen_82_part_10